MKKPRKPIGYVEFKRALKLRGDRFTWQPGEVEVHGSPKSDKFAWQPGDVEVHPRKRKRLRERLEEAWFPNSAEDNPEGHQPGSYHHPHPEPSHDWDDNHSANDHDHESHRDQFEDHAADLRKNHPDTVHSIRHYKQDGYERINKDLRSFLTIERNESLNIIHMSASFVWVTHIPRYPGGVHAAKV